MPNAGSIRLDGRELLRLRPHEVISHGVSRTFQNVALFPRMSVLDNVLVGDHTDWRRPIPSRRRCDSGGPAAPSGRPSNGR